MKKIINVGRQFGSGGKEVALKLGEILGMKVYDSEILSQAAKESGLSPEIFSRSDEKRRWSFVSSIFGVNRYGSMSGTNGMNDAELFRIQSETIRKIASEGPAIFVGRASDYVLRDMDCLDVFICAPMEERIKRICQRMDLDAEKAEQLILKKDKGRAEFYNFFTFTEWGVASNYDLCVDSSILGVKGTAEFIIEFLNRTSEPDKQ